MQQEQRKESEAADRSATWDIICCRRGARAWCVHQCFPHERHRKNKAHHAGGKSHGSVFSSVLHFIHNKWFQRFLIALLVLDVLAVCAEMFLTGHACSMQLADAYCEANTTAALYMEKTGDPVPGQYVIKDVNSKLGPLAEKGPYSSFKTCAESGYTLAYYEAHLKIMDHGHGSGDHGHGSGDHGSTNHTDDHHPANATTNHTSGGGGGHHRRLRRLQQLPQSPSPSSSSSSNNYHQTTSRSRDRSGPDSTSTLFRYSATLFPRVLSSSGGHGHGPTTDHDASIHTIHEVEHVIHWISITILFIFLTELVVLMIVMSCCEFWTHAFYVLDLVVVSLSIVLDLALGDEEFGWLIVLRAWRFARVFHGLVMAQKELAEEENQEHLGEMEEALTGLIHVIEKLRVEIKDQRDLCKEALTNCQEKVVETNLKRVLESQNALVGEGEAKVLHELMEHVKKYIPHYRSEFGGADDEDGGGGDGIGALEGTGGGGKGGGKGEHHGGHASNKLHHPTNLRMIKTQSGLFLKGGS